MLNQSATVLRTMANKVGIPNERSDQIKVLGDLTATNVATFRLVVNKVGYYNEKADHLVAAGVTFS